MIDEQSINFFFLSLSPLLAQSLINFTRLPVLCICPTALPASYQTPSFRYILSPPFAEQFANKKKPTPCVIIFFNFNIDICAENIC
jgi:hypothetical protein